MPTERRSFKRTELNLSISVSSEKKPSTTFIAQVLNISTGNIFFISEHDLSPDERLTLQLPTIYGILTVSAVVVRKYENRYGCQYVDLSRETTEKIKNWLFPPYEP